MAGKQPGIVREFLTKFVGSIGLMFIPLPIGIFRRQLAGKHTPAGGLEFYSHPNLVCTMHLIWVGWLVTLGEAFNEIAAKNEWNAHIPDRWLIWPWLIVLIVTLIVMGLKFGRVQLGFLIAALAVSLLGLWLLQVLSARDIFGGILRTLRGVPVVVQWGVPMIVSFALGVCFVGVAAWRRMNDKWTLKPVGNYLEHENFQEKDRTISKGAKTFVAVYPCLLRHYLMFGFGDIEVRSSTGSKIIDRIEGVFFARQHAEVIKRQFATTDIEALAEAEEAQEDEEAADEAL